MTANADELYTQSFEKFLQFTNEKTVFIQTIEEYIRRYGARSLVDIGAGNGTLAVAIARGVPRYLAVESNPKYAAKLRNAGLSVVDQAFPVAVPGRYDMALLSHVISYRLGNYASLIPAAWDLLSEHGHLLVVTHRGGEIDDWSSLLEAIDLGESERFANSFQDIMALLNEYGSTQISKVTTTLEAQTASDMVAAMAFVASNGDPDRSRRFMAKAGIIERLLESQYRTNNGFSFPFLHLFVSTHKG